MKKEAHYGIYGGQYVAETLMTPLLELERAYAEAKADPAFQAEFREICGKVREMYPDYKVFINLDDDISD